MKLIFMLLIFIYLLLNIYVVKKYLSLLKEYIPRKYKFIPIFIYIFLSLPSVFLFSISGRSIGNILGVFSNYWLFFIMYNIIFFIIYDILKLILKDKINLKPLSIFLILIISFTTITIYGRYIATNLKITNYKININKKSDISSLKAVMISDLHLGYVNGLKDTKKLVKKINEENPDIIFLVGDIFDDNYHSLAKSGLVSDELKKLKSKYGTFAVLGNHDSGSTISKMKSFLKESNITLLEDEIKVIDDSFVLVGRRDIHPNFKTSPKRVNIKDQIKTKSNYPIFVLDHQPSTINEYEFTDVDLILCGHTHKGQIFPFGIVTNMYFDVDYGYYQKNKDNPQVVVTSGVGTWGPPIRLASKKELVTLNLRFNK